MSALIVIEKINKLTFGKWHIFVFCQIFWMVLIMAMVNSAVVFMEETPQFACNNELFDNSNWTFEQILQFSTPSDRNGHNGCLMYNKNYSDYKGISYASASILPNITSYSKCHTGYIFHPHEEGMHLTVVSQWSLVCENAIQVSNMVFIYMAGFFVGCVLAGPLADQFGRKPIIMIAQLSILILGIGDALVPSFVLFMIGRFLIGIFNGGTSGVIYVLCMEYLNERQRTLMGALYFIIFAVGYALVALVAWAVRDWRYMHIICSAPLIASMIFFWTLPESPRWLASRGRLEEATRIINKALIWNGDDVVDDTSVNDVKVNFDTTSTLSSQGSLGDMHSEKLTDLLRHPKLLLQTLNVFFNWVANAMVYYGISLLITSFAGNVFINNAIGGLIEIPAYLLCLPLLWWARKKSLMLCLLVGGVCMLLYLAVPSQGYAWAQLLVAFVGKFFITASFNLIYVVTVEIFPTSIRAATLTLSSMAARIGSMVAPYINAAANKNDVTIPMVVFGCFALVAGMLTWWIPESQNKKLPENIDEASKMTLR